MECGNPLVVEFNDRLCNDCRIKRNNKKVINSSGVVKITCDQCPAVKGPHCSDCNALKGEHDDFSDAIQMMSKQILCDECTKTDKDGE